jgi:hypothetical protein
MTTDLTSPAVAEPTGARPRPARRTWRRPALLIAVAAVGVAGVVGVGAMTNHDEAPVVPTDPWCAQHRPC